MCGIVGTAQDLAVVAAVDTGTTAVEAARAQHADVVLMDVRMPDMDGIEATRLICAPASGPVPRVLILTTFDLDEYVYGALRAGASGFLLKDTPPTDLIAAVRVIAAGDALLAPGITRRLITEFTARQAPLPTPALRDLAGVTTRERQVLILVAEGLSNAEIAHRLHITTGTAKTHVGHLLTKFQVRDRIQLVILAHRTGLVPGQPSLSGDAPESR
ncbi:response regulator [Actinacidiphila paucisporea]|uniref:response regulator n=1 Tax=Actinacidiphila paucisporea TaxID=310782 RepID=UPI0038991DBE